MNTHKKLRRGKLPLIALSAALLIILGIGGWHFANPAPTTIMAPGPAITQPLSDSYS